MKMAAALERLNSSSPNNDSNVSEKRFDQRWNIIIFLNLSSNLNEKFYKVLMSDKIKGDYRICTAAWF